MPKRKRTAPAGDQQVQAARESEKVTVVPSPDRAHPRMRAAVFYTPGLIVTGLVERAVTAELKRVERQLAEAMG